jgi:hypothetical protein
MSTPPRSCASIVAALWIIVALFLGAAALVTKGATTDSTATSLTTEAVAVPPDVLPGHVTTTVVVPPTTTSTVPPAPTTTTSTVPAAPTTPPPAPPVSAPSPAPTPPAAPAPAPPAPAPAPLSPESAYARAVPSAWRSVFSVRFEVIAGSTSWGWSSGLIQLAVSHQSDPARLMTTIAHEFGHLIAYRYGSQGQDGSAPTGWPAYSGQPVEAWADCVAQAFTGIVDPSHGLPPCSGSSLSWARTWLAQGPGAHPRTG